MSHGEHNSADKYTGIKSNYALLDEINISPEGAGVVQQLGMRLENGSIILTMNPTRRLEWVSKLEANPKTCYIHSTYKDNIDSLPKDLVDDLEYQGSVDNRFKAVYLEGRYMADSDLAVFNNFDVVNTWPDNPKWVSWGQDYGFKNDSTTLVETCFYDGALWIRAHLYEHGMSTSAIREANSIATSIIIADSSEPRLIEELGSNVVGIKKYPGHKKDAVRAMLQNPIKLYYDNPHLVAEFEDYQWKKKSGVILDELSDGNDHLLDAVFYAVRDKLKVNLGKYSFR